MAKDKDKDKKAAEPGEKKKPGLIATIVPILLVTLLAGGGGFAFGHFMMSPKPAEPAAHAAEGEAPAAEASAHGETAAEGEKKPEAEHAAEAEHGSIVRAVAPIVTNLQSPKEAWIRLEISLVLKAEAAGEQDLIAVEAGDKVLGLLRTIALNQIEGPSGLLYLREDLNDLLVGGHDSQVQQVLINSMVVE